MKIPITRLSPDLPIPIRASEHAAAVDLSASVDSPVTLAPGERALIPTGIAVAIPAGWEGQVRPRSGLAARNGVSIVNAPGTIDADYRGEIKVILINLGDESFTVSRGDRVAQLLVTQVPMWEFEEVDELPATARGAGGFGSTGR